MRGWAMRGWLAAEGRFCAPVAAGGFSVPVAAGGFSVPVAAGGFSVPVAAGGFVPLVPAGGFMVPVWPDAGGFAGLGGFGGLACCPESSAPSSSAASLAPLTWLAPSVMPPFVPSFWPDASFVTFVWPVALFMLPVAWGAAWSAVWPETAPVAFT